jgi:hypothetical protein
MTTVKTPPKASRKTGSSHHDSAEARKNSNPDKGRTGAKQDDRPGTARNDDGQQTDTSGTGKQNLGRDDECQSDTKIPPSVESLLSELRATGDTGLPYERIETLAKLSDTQLGTVFSKLKEILGRKLIMADFRKAIKEARARQRKADAKAATERQLGGHPYRVSHGRMVRVSEKNDTTQIIPLTNFVATIKEDITEDDGVETKRLFRIEAELGSRRYSFIIQAGELSSMEWPIKHIGPTAIVNPNQKDWARAAVQSLSTGIQEQRIFTHTGWRKLAKRSCIFTPRGRLGPPDRR